MPSLDVTLQVPEVIAQGLASGALERVGGVVRYADSKQIVMWLREGGQLANNADLAGGFLRPLLNAGSGGVLSAATDLSQLAATARSHHLIMQQLSGVTRMLGVVGGIGVVNIAVSAVSLGVILRRLSEIERKLDSLHLEFNRNREVRLRAGLEAAQDASVASVKNNRRIYAREATNKLREARIFLLQDIEQLMANGVNQQLICRLVEAMQLDILRIRCYLEFDDLHNAKRHLEAALKDYREKGKQSISRLLGTERAVYFHPSVSDRDLWRFVAILQWQHDSDIRPEAVLVDALLACRQDFWNQELAPVADEADRLAFFHNGLAIFHNLLSQGDADSAEDLPAHLSVLDYSDTLIENYDRLHGLLAEIEAIERLGISSSAWESQQRAALETLEMDLEDYGDYVGLVDKEAMQRLEIAA